MISGHLDIADGTVISAATPVFDSIASAGVYTGAFPALPHRDWRQVASQIAAAARAGASACERCERRAGAGALDTAEGDHELSWTSA